MISENLKIKVYSYYVPGESMTLAKQGNVLFIAPDIVHLIKYICMLLMFLIQEATVGLELSGVD